MRSPTLSRWYWLLRSHRPSQLAWRAWRLFERKLPMSYWRRKCRVPRGTLTLRPEAVCGFELITQRRSLNQSQEAVIGPDGSSILTFLGITRSMSLPADWRSESIETVPHLWRFHVHDQRWLICLPEEHRWLWVLDWIEANPLRDKRELSDAWHPFCVSHRVVTWMLMWHQSPPVEHQDTILTSLARQVMFLSRHLEWDLRGNHLMFNLWALGIAAAFFDGPVGERALSIVRRHLPRQLKEQILPSGEHFERSPMYHAGMLGVLQDLETALTQFISHLPFPPGRGAGGEGQHNQDASNRAELPEDEKHLQRIVSDIELGVTCGAARERMEHFLSGIMHPDGQIPLLGDSAFDAVPRSGLQGASAMRDQCAFQRSVASGPRCGYWTFENERSGDFVLFDPGPVGADELPAHAHCDLLGLEASIGGNRFLVDSGVFDYEDSEMRMYCRSTFAHNVLQIDDVDQCDVWSRFRMGYRGWPAPAVHGTTSDGFHWCRATHNAYRRIGVREVGRLVACREDGIWAIVDWAASGRGRHQLTTRLHLHPDVVIEHVDEASAKVTIGERSLLISGHGPGKLVLERGWYCPRFGERHENTILSWRTDRVSLPVAPGWLIQPASNTPATLEVEFDKSPQIRVRRNADNWQIPVESQRAAR